MAHPNLENRTRLVMEPVHITDRDGGPLLVCIVKGTFLLDGAPRLASDDQQMPVELAGQHYGEPETTSLKYEPESAFVKPATDVALIGHAIPKSGGQKSLDVRLRVGTLEKTVRVFGDRTWNTRMGLADKSPPAVIEKPIPLIYELAFGGWDREKPDPLSSKFHAQNPIGVGFPRIDFQDGHKLPNLEDPANLLSMYGETPNPAGFGFIGPNWLPRRKWAGTYDSKWQNKRAPLLPSDFDERFFNAASPGLISSEYLKGNEPVLIENVHAQGPIQFNLPGIAPPVVKVRLRGNRNHQLQTILDTVIINTDEMKLFLIWRARLGLLAGPHDVAALELTCASPQVQIEKMVVGN